MDEPIFPEGWYPVATSRELRRKPLRRELCGRALVLYRDAGGRAVALHDRCPHRSAPLSGGRVVGGEIECPYHGWRFNGEGPCTLIPFHDGDLPRRLVPTVPVEERHGLVFARHGSGDAQIYTPFWQGTEKVLRKIIPTSANTSLVNVMENVLDPTHTAFTHKSIMRGMSAARQNVDFRLIEKDGALELTLTGEQRQDGLISRLLGERNRTGSTTNIRRPGIVEAIYWHNHALNLVTTVYFSPVNAHETRGFIVLTTAMKYGLAYLKSAIFLPMFRTIIRQDQAILGASYANWTAFGAPPNATSPLDFMRPNLEALLAGREPPVSREPLSLVMRL